MAKNDTFYPLIILANSICAPAFALTIDGQLNEKQWQTATQYNQFYQVVPATLESVDDKVNAKVFTTEDGIYIGIVNYQSIDQRKKQFNLQDGFMQADFNRFVIDFSGDGSGAYMFSVTLGGGMQDAVLTPQLTTDYDWDGDWQYAYHEEQDYWSTEAFIPWQTVSFKNNVAVDGSSQIGISFQLYDLARNYIYGSQKQTTGNSDFYLKMPKISAQIPTQQMLSFVPYVTQVYDAVESHNQTDIGFDLVYKPDHHQKLSLAVNPDFGQVDSDELVVNYSAVETLRTDKRPFFTQDISVFNVATLQDTKLIHTRRMGAGSDDGEHPVTPIDIASRFVHQSEQWQFGAFAVKEGEDAGKDFYATRLKYRTPQWQFGILATHVERPWYERQANTMTFDNQYQSGSWSMQSALMMSEVSENSKTSGYGFSGNLKYQFNANSDVSLSHLRLDERFDINDLGYTQRNDWRYSDVKFNYSFNGLTTNISRFKNTLNLSQQENDDGLKLQARQSYTGNLLLANGSQVEMVLGHYNSGWNDNIGYSSDHFYLDSHNGLRLMYISPYANWFSWAASFQYDEEGVNGRAQQYALDMTFMPHSLWTIKFNNFYRTGDGWLIANQNNLLTQYDRDFFVNSSSVTGLLSEDLELSVNLQWALLDAKQQQQFKIENHDLVAGHYTDASFTDKRLSSQVKLRYRLGPLSDVYLVYNRNGELFEEHASSLSFGSSFKSLWQQRDVEKLTLKVRYLF